MAAKTVKMCDMSEGIAQKVFEMLNPGEITIKKNPWFGICIYTDTEPKDLWYPEGWYYAKGFFRNKHLSTTGRYYEVRMFKNSGESWGYTAKYCTLDD